MSRIPKMNIQSGPFVTWADAAKIGSALIHAEEALSPGAHPFDLTAFRTLLADPAVADFLDGLSRQALLPVKR